MSFEMDCPKDCCSGPTPQNAEATRRPPPSVRAKDNCGNRTTYCAAAGLQFKYGTPLIAGEEPGSVTPLDVTDPEADWTGFVGISTCFKTTTPENTSVSAIRCDVILCYTDIAAALNLDPTSESDWWSIYVPMMAAGILVEFE